MTLTALAAAGSRFTGWSGGDCSGAKTCTLALGADTIVTAAFARLPVVNLALSVQAPPSVHTGDPFTVRYTVTNTGPTHARDVELTATLDDDVVLAGELPAGCSQPAGTRTVTCRLGALAGGTETTVVLPVRSRVVGANCDLWGTSGPDHLVDATDQGRVLCGLGGADLLEAGDGADSLWGNAPPGSRPFLAGFNGIVTSRLVEADITDNRGSARVAVLLGVDGIDDLDCGSGTDRFAEEPAGGLLRDCEEVISALTPSFGSGSISTGSPEPSAPSPEPGPTPTGAPGQTPISGVTEGQASLESPQASLEFPSALPGGVAAVAGSGCPAGEAVALSIAGSPVGVTTADDTGSFRANVQVPLLPIGRHTVDVQCGSKDFALPIDLVVSTQAITPPGAATTVGLVLLFLLLGGMALMQNSPVPSKARGAAPSDDEDD